MPRIAALLRRNRREDCYEVPLRQSRKENNEVTPKEEIIFLLKYEIAASDWWVSLIGWKWLQNLAATYFLWKTKRKHASWKRTETRAKQVGALREMLNRG